MRTIVERRCCTRRRNRCRSPWVASGHLAPLDRSKVGDPGACELELVAQLLQLTDGLRTFVLCLPLNVGDQLVKVGGHDWVGPGA